MLMLPTAIVGTPWRGTVRYLGRLRRARLRASSARGPKAPSRRSRRSFCRWRRSGRFPCRCACPYPDSGAGRARRGGGCGSPAPPFASRGSPAAARSVADCVSAGSPMGQSWGMGHTGFSGARKVSAKLPKKVGRGKCSMGFGKSNNYLERASSQMGAGDIRSLKSEKKRKRGIGYEDCRRRGALRGSVRHLVAEPLERRAD